MRSFFSVLLIVSCLNGNCQLIDHATKLLNRQPTFNTSILLTYYKNVDKILLQKLDSFDLFLKEIKYQVDTNYFYCIGFSKRGDKLTAAVNYASMYNDYLFYTNSGHYSGVKYRQNVFAFFFYKNKLVICFTFIGNFTLTKDAESLLKNLMYEHIDESEKKLIGNPPKGIAILAKPVKRYYLE